MANIIVINGNSKTATVQDKLTAHGVFVANNGLKKEDIVFFENEGQISLLGVITGGAGYDSMAKKGVVNFTSAFKDKETFEKTNGLKFYKSDVHGNSTKVMELDEFNKRIGVEDEISADERTKAAMKVVEELKAPVVSQVVQRIGLELK